ncbi:uncharacterized protein LOC130070521 [Rhinichthys klamathensis goyatoka]|uniref:uncharacterized protein LOC130070521 n=1 Tax=Rhinichthys klamathensis goyatoka TaxID=3034132 RepID=UPI0024B62083|nr:uncharacterized protein LOC130070521 [Rhinichthys klamathensis goyatoka]
MNVNDHLCSHLGVERYDVVLSVSEPLPFNDESVSKVRILRSALDDGPEQRRASHLLPARCLICRKNQYVIDSHRKRKKEKLSKCETLTAGNLLFAAEDKMDERVLIHIRGRDLVASEAMYHQSCYKRYTSYLYKKHTQGSEDNPYQAGYDHFCQSVVEERLLKKREVLRLSRLNELFKAIVKEREGTDISAYTVCRLKARLQKSHPCLKFLKSSKNYLVFVEDLCAEEIIPDVATQQSSSSDQSDDDNEDDTEPSRVMKGQTYERLLYHAAMSLKEIIQEKCKCTAKLPWPPTAQDLNIDTALRMIPPQLYNVIAWITGTTSEFQSGVQHVSVGVDEKQKIGSMCQDIMNLAMRGRWLMPKHTALAMAVRHMTGSAQVIGILNGLGHCSSHSQVLEHDTALAELQLERGDTYIPPSIVPEISATLVWDNNDFGEETLSGKGTTHNTNGIIIQKPTSSDVLTSEFVSLQKSRKRSLKTPPIQIDIFTRGKRAGPECFRSRIEVGCEICIPVQATARTMDSAYFFMKTQEVQRSVLPGWTGYNTLLQRGAIPPQSNIGYLPVIDASPTDLNTVHTILTRSIAIADKLKLSEIVLVMDQAIYSKAQEIRWTNKTFQERLVLRMGEFHTAMAYLACIGKRFGDAGFQDVMIEAEVVAAGSVEGVISGHQYNRSMRVHKLMCEALQRLRWQAYLDILPEDGREAAVKTAVGLQTAFPGEEFDDLVMSENFQKVMKGYEDFIKDNTTNKTFHFWCTYIAMVEDLLLFIRGTREANWSLHLSSVRSIMPWFFCYDRINYARYLSTYWMEMVSLGYTHPNINHQLQSGDFVAQRQQTYGFAYTACDQVIEQTANRDSKTKGGLTGF